MSDSQVSLNAEISRKKKKKDFLFFFTVAATQFLLFAAQYS